MARCLAVHYLDGSLNTVTYPSGRTLSYVTGGAGRLLSVQDNSTTVYYANSAHYAPQGALASISNGSVLSSTHLYNSRLQPCWLYTSTGSALPATTLCTATETTPGNILDLQYSYSFGVSNNGNVAGIANNRDTTRSQNFGYDSLNRLNLAETTSTQATSPTNCWGEAFQYDNQSTGGAWGNLTGIVGASSAYNGCVQESLSVVAASNNQLAQSSGYCYDAAGNLVLQAACPTGSFTPTYSYDAENHLVAVAGVTYLYDGDGARAAKSVGGTVDKIYWYGSEREALDERRVSTSLRPLVMEFSEHFHLS